MGVYRDVVETDVLINVRIAKYHLLARLSLRMKNLLGVVAAPNRIHLNSGQRLAGLASLIRTTLTIGESVRLLVAHGPTGGSRNDAVRTEPIIASPDVVSADAWLPSSSTWPARMSAT